MPCLHRSRYSAEADVSAPMWAMWGPLCFSSFCTPASVLSTWLHAAQHLQRSCCGCCCGNAALHRGCTRDSSLPRKAWDRERGDQAFLSPVLALRPAVLVCRVL